MDRNDEIDEAKVKKAGKILEGEKPPACAHCTGEGEA